jgi:CRISPR/Cas system-associated exonuclease Cas4 (RecB family)
MSDSEQLAHVNWSASAAGIFEECPRRFFYRYQRSESTGGDSEYTPPHRAYLGTVVHDAIENQVTRWAQGEKVHFQTATGYAKDKLERYVEANTETIADRIGDDGEGEFDRDSFTRWLIRKAHNHIETFFSVIWPQFDGHLYITHETRQTFDVAGETVTVKPDLCTRNSEGDFVVTDWKTGEYERFSNPTIQMQAYALYAYNSYEPELNRVQVRLVHTGSGQFDPMTPTKEDIKQVRERIKNDRDFWTGHGDIESYETDPEPQKCKYCSYLCRCTDGKEIVDETNNQSD